MTKSKLEKYLTDFKGAVSSYPFGEDVLVFKVKGKMFALVSQNKTPTRVTLKCRPADCEMLVSQYKSIDYGYYMNKRHWVTLTLSNEVSDEMMVGLLAGSYKLVVDKLPKKEKIRLV